MEQKTAYIVAFAIFLVLMMIFTFTDHARRTSPPPNAIQSDREPASG